MDVQWAIRKSNISQVLFFFTTWLPQWLSGKGSVCSAGDLETWVQSLGGEDPLEEEMATDSNIFARKIPWTEEPGRLQFMGSQKSQTRLGTHIHIYTF